MKNMEPEPGRGIVILESRKFPRENIEIPLSYSIRNDDGNYNGHLEDEIEGGILIYIKADLDVGTNLDIEIFPPEYFALKPIKGLTQIVWTQLRGTKDGDEYEYGLKFIDMDGDNIQQLKKLLEYVEQ
jgi:hypothetical protein